MTGREDNPEVRMGKSRQSMVEDIDNMLVEPFSDEELKIILKEKNML